MQFKHLAFGPWSHFLTGFGYYYFIYFLDFLGETGKLGNSLLSFWEDLGDF